MVRVFVPWNKEVPTTYKIDKKAGVVYRNISGSVTTQELLKSYALVLKDPIFRPGMKALTDLRQVESYALRKDVEEIMGFVMAHHREIESLKVAVVVSAESSFGMVRMLRSYLDLEASKVEIGVFRGIEEARAWLDVDR